MFNVPIKNGLNRRRKCTGINPYEMTLDYVVATKARVGQQKTSPDLRPLWRGGRWETTGGVGRGGEGEEGGRLIVGGFVVQLRKKPLVSVVVM